MTGQAAADGSDPSDREARLEGIIEAMQVGTWEWNVVTGELAVNERWAEIVGYTLDELAPVSIATWERLTHPDDLAASNEQLERYFAAEIPYYDVDVRMRHKDGRWVSVVDRGKVITRTASGDPLLMVGTHIDVTDRSRAREALQLAEQKFYLSLEFMSDAVYLLRDGEWIYSNTAGLRLLGAARPDQLLGTPYMERVHPDYRKLVARRVRETKDTFGRAKPVELRLLRMDGTVVDVESTATYMQLGDDVIRQVVIRDITERKRAAAELEHTRDLMQYVIEHARSAVAVHDRDLRYLYVSRRYLQEYGVTEQDILGKHHYDVFPDLPQKWRDAHTRALAGEVLSAENDPYPREDGSTDWTRWECRPWYEADGSIGGIIVYTEVINEQKRVEEALLQYQKRLRALAAELVASSEREQRRFAIELHDGIGQLLVAAKMEAQGIVSQDGQQTAVHVVELLSETIDEVRALTAHLAPSVLIGRGLAVALRWLADRYSELFSLKVTVRVDDEVEDQDIEMKMLIFRICREALNNVARHSGVCRAMVSVRRSSGQIQVAISDRGAGFDPGIVGTPADGHGFGLFSINEECLIRGGALKVWSAPGKGTRVTASIPEGLASVAIG